MHPSLVDTCMIEGLSIVVRNICHIDRIAIYWLTLSCVLRISGDWLACILNAVEVKDWDNWLMVIRFVASILVWYICSCCVLEKSSNIIFEGIVSSISCRAPSNSGANDCSLLLLRTEGFYQMLAMYHITFLSLFQLLIISFYLCFIYLSLILWTPWQISI